MPDMDARLARHKQFWGPKFEGEGAYFAAASPLPQFRSAQDRYAHWLDLDYRLKVASESFEDAFFLGDAVPRIDPDFGPGFLPALLGRPYRIGGETVWFDIEPFSDAWEIYELELRKDLDYYRTFSDFTREMCERSEGRYMVGVTDPGSETDILASLYERESLLMDMVLDPDRIKRLLSKTGEWWREITLENERLIRGAQNYTAAWVPVINERPWGPLLSELSAMVSPAVFADIIAPSLERMSSVFEQILFNLDGNSYVRHLPEILKLDKLHSIEWDPNPKWGPGGAEKDFTTEESISVIREILERGKKMVFNEIPAWQVPVILERIPRDGVFFYLEFERLNEAEDFLESVRRWMR
jgi:hypothetical protein